MSKERNNVMRNCLEIPSTISAKHFSCCIHYPINNLVLIKPVIILPLILILLSFFEDQLPCPTWNRLQYSTKSTNEFSNHNFIVIEFRGFLVDSCSKSQIPGIWNMTLSKLTYYSILELGNSKKKNVHGYTFGLKIHKHKTTLTFTISVSSEGNKIKRAWPSFWYLQSKG